MINDIIGLLLKSETPSLDNQQILCQLVIVLCTQPNQQFVNCELRHHRDLANPASAYPYPTLAYPVRLALYAVFI